MEHSYASQFPDIANISVFRIQKMPRLLVASHDGYLYIYNLDPSEGGDCTLLKQHRFAAHNKSFNLLTNNWLW